jgi:cardiolipin synthase
MPVMLGMDGTWGAWTYFAAEWVVRIGMILIVLAKKRPNVALAWLAVVLFHPLAALVLYLLIGTVRVEPEHAERYAQLREAKRGEPADESAAAAVDPRHRDLLRLSESLNLLTPTAGNRVALVGEHGAFIDGLVAEIDRAQRRAWLLYYIFWDDASGRRVAEALERAAKRGVECRLLADAAGSRSLFGGLGARLRSAGVRVQAALPVKPWRALLVRTDLRNHRKLAVIDDRVAWTGSHNVCDADYGGNPCGPWIDLSARITGPAARQLAGVFAEDWYAETGEMLEASAWSPDGAVEAGGPGTVIQAFRSGPAGMADTLEPFLVGAMHEAEERVVITSPYLIPTQPLLLELRVAVLRGVRVDLIVPDRSNHPVVHAAGRAFFDELLDAGVRVHLHRPGLLHSKTMLVDGSFALVGTANFDVRSIALNFELNLLLFGAGVVADLARHHEAYLAKSRRLEREQWRQRGRARRLAEDTARLFSPLL